ncbi:MAG TPA: FAD-binding oxidoreductase [Candidatus Saccharimonadales bacterium]|nr:FAD-binding oxidoreductase [Candidatus Saccharimonadales bacterium]
MSKVAEYLQEHITGEISVHPAILNAMSHDASILELKPEMVIYPRVTNDIRKVARFSWQLAEKGHVLPLTARGYGTDETGGAIGKGAVLVTTAHMNKLLEFDPKQKLIRIQPGLNAKSLNDALALHGLAIPALPPSALYSSIGGIIASNASGLLSGQYGDMHTWAYQLEVVLANGDVLQTERISKRELARRKGLQTFEGEIYRTVDNLIEDNKQLIEEKIGTDGYDASGYSAIAKVKQRDGSFDLAPLLVGSQGTLGIISEMIIRADFTSMHLGVLVAAFPTKEAARDSIDELRQLEPALLEYFDGDLFDIAASAGKRYGFLSEGAMGGVVIIGFNDFSDHNRRKKLKKAEKMLGRTEANVIVAEGEDGATLLAAREVTNALVMPNKTGASAPPLLDGAYVPGERLEEFSKALEALALKYHVELPLHVDMLTGIIYTRPILYMHKVSDRQKILKLVDEYAALVAYHNGCFVAEGGEGRLKARFAYAQLDDDVKELYADIKAAFDPYGILNPGVKQEVEVRQLVAMLRKDYDTARFANYSLYA